MAVRSDRVLADAGSGDLRKVAALLFGEAHVPCRRLSSALDVHDLLLTGLPPSALDHLIGQLALIDKTVVLAKAFGMSPRAWRRRKAAPSKPLSQEQSGRAWKFAEILAKATDVLGSQAEAELWLLRPAIGLDQRRPIDLLGTPVGVELLENHLERLKYCVYA